MASEDGIIATERLHLKPMRVEDAPEILAINDVEDVRKQLYVHESDSCFCPIC
jgi:hypothetical protein